MYIYIFEDGRVGTSESAPGFDDMLCIGDGTLEVLLVDGDVIRGIKENGVDQYALPDADWNDESTKEYHVIHD